MYIADSFFWLPDKHHIMSRHESLRKMLLFLIQYSVFVGFVESLWFTRQTSNLWFALFQVGKGSFSGGVKGGPLNSTSSGGGGGGRMRFNKAAMEALASQPSHKFEKEGALFIREKQEGFFRKTEGTQI